MLEVKLTEASRRLRRRDSGEPPELRGATPPHWINGVILAALVVFDFECSTGNSEGNDRRSLRRASVKVVVLYKPPHLVRMAFECQEDRTSDPPKCLK